ncbi:MAG: alternative ribosome rescue aminoacyl-tRNA hydrolase ArfB [Lentisphaeria bacterium]|jgi:ribosome-associated protein
MIPITDNLALDERELRFSSLRAAGPGGQHVNRTESAIRLEFDVAATTALPPAVKARLRRLAGARLTAGGVLALTSDLHRSQARNRDEVIARLVELLRKAATPPKRRIPTKAGAGARARRRETKRQRGTLKDARRRPAAEG